LLPVRYHTSLPERHGEARIEILQPHDVLNEAGAESWAPRGYARQPVYHTWPLSLFIIGFFLFQSNDTKRLLIVPAHFMLAIKQF
jgi:hypothetical protein